MSGRRTPRRASTVSLAFAALAAALIAVCSWITIPTAVPFTLQTFAVFCALLLLGGRYGTLAVAVYLLLGAVGVPVFAGLRGGLGALFGATGGYLLGFLLMALTYWTATALCGNRWAVQVLSLAAGQLLCYAFGTAWFVTVYAREGGTVGIATALGWCVLPFLLPDAAKLSLAAALCARLKKFVRFENAAFQ